MEEEGSRAQGKADSSIEATILDFEWDGELVAPSSSWVSPSTLIQDQLLYTIGHLNGSRAVGRLDRVRLTNIRSTSLSTSRRRITYHAKMPVAWGSKTNFPSSYAFTLPKDVTYDGQAAFTSKYKSTCVDSSAHDVDAGSMWYYYRPRAYGCQLADADVVRFTARVTVSPVNTTGKYPEYHEIWEDNALRVVAIFGKYEDGATSSSDAGIAAYNSFARSIKGALSSYSLVTQPAAIPYSPGVAVPDITLTATLPGGRKVIVNALLVDNVRTAGAAFDVRYESLSTRADLIVYNGHAGLGQNVRALARKGRWVAGQYVIFFMNGCDTFAYVDGSLAETRAAVNPDDPTGTKYMEILVNGMPSYFSSNPSNSMTLIRALMGHDRPKTYEQIFAGIDSTQVVIVTGEEDNVFRPSGGGGWSGLSASGTVAAGEEKRWQTPQLPAGRYVFETSGTGDVDLYVRRGTAPTTSTYDCRPYTSDSNERCAVSLSSPDVVHVLVRGYASSSTFRLVGRVE